LTQRNVIISHPLKLRFQRGPLQHPQKKQSSDFDIDTGLVERPELYRGCCDNSIRTGLCKLMSGASGALPAVPLSTGSRKKPLHVQGRIHRREIVKVRPWSDKTFRRFSLGYERLSRSSPPFAHAIAQRKSAEQLCRTWSHQ